MSPALQLPIPSRLPAALLLPLLLLMLLLLPSGAQADEPHLAVRLSGGDSAVYALGDIERIGFEDQDTLVVVTGSGPESFATETIVRIEFLWTPASAEDPAGAAGLVKALHLFQNQPNPFSPQTRIGFELPGNGSVELSIYAPDGRLVRTLLDGQREAGHHTVRWDGRDDSGRRASGGVYFYILRAPGIEESRQMILLP